jgi:hypothetical protein
MRHIGAVIAHLDSNVLDRRNYAGERGGIGVQQFEGRILARLPCFAHRGVKTRNLIFHAFVKFVEAAPHVHGRLPGQFGRLVSVDRGIDRIGSRCGRMCWR